MSIKSLPAIDVHAHYGTYLQANTHQQIIRFMSGDAKTVIERARQANTELTFVSPLQALMPRLEGDPITANKETACLMKETPELRQWVVLDPIKPETYTQAEEILPTPQCVGIKIHPEEHGYPILDHVNDIFEFAQKHQATILTHSGEENSLPKDFVKAANDFPEVKLILAHLGCGWDGDLTHQVRAIQNAKHNNLYVDTSSAQSIMPGLIEWAVKEIGADQILYGTDTPLYFAPVQRARIDHAEINNSDKQKILRDNAVTLFNL